MNTKLERNRIGIFLAIAFGWAYAAGLLVYLTGGVFDSQPLFGNFNSFTVIIALLYMPAPAIAHVLTRWLTGEGWQNLYLRPKFKQGWKYMLLVWALTAVSLIIGTALFYLLLPQYFDGELTQFNELIVQLEVQSGEPVPFPPVVLLLIQAISALTVGIIINTPFMLGEEFGWRAYLQQKLMPLGPRKAMILMGIIWGLWHAPLIWMGYNYGSTNNNMYWGAPWSGIMAMCWMTFVTGTLLGWTTFKAGSVWPAVIGHAIINGLGPMSLVFAQGDFPTLLGPAVVGVIGSIGFTVFTLWAFLSPQAWKPTAVADSAEVATPRPSISTS